MSSSGRSAARDSRAAASPASSSASSPADHLQHDQPVHRVGDLRGVQAEREHLVAAQLGADEDDAAGRLHRHLGGRSPAWLVGGGPAAGRVAPPGRRRVGGGGDAAAAVADAQPGGHPVAAQPVHQLLGAELGIELPGQGDPVGQPGAGVGVQAGREGEVDGGEEHHQDDGEQGEHAPRSPGRAATAERQPHGRNT